MRAILSVFLPFALLFFAPLSFAASDDPEPKPTETTQKCEEGSVWDADAKKCVAIKQSQLNDKQIYETGRELAYYGRYQDAITLLKKAKQQDNPKILNYLGFTHRKAGDFKLALEYYQRAIVIDPNYVLARSYMGQGYVADGQIDLAALQLAEIRKRSGESSWAYQALHGAITDGGGVY